MKIVLAFVVLVLVGIVLCAPDKNAVRKHKTDKKWQAFKAKHMAKLRSFKTEDDEADHYENFNKVDALIEKHNAKFEKGEATSTMDHNFMSADSEAEKKVYLGALVHPIVPSPPKSKRSATTFANTCGATLPTSFDWVAQGWNPAVRDQRTCGSCWAFATAGALEAHYWIKNKQNIVVSPQQMVSCSTRNLGCKGGFLPEALDYVYSAGGIAVEGNYPYENANGTCRNPAKTLQVSSTFEQITPGDVNALKCALATRGPVALVLDGSAPPFAYYKYGIVVYTSQSQYNHAVLAVGYGVENGVEYIKIRNSYGSTWGQEGGYVRVGIKTSAQQLVTGLFSVMVLPKLSNTAIDATLTTKSAIFGTCTNKAGNAYCTQYATSCGMQAKIQNSLGVQELFDDVCAQTCGRCGSTCSDSNPTWCQQNYLSCRRSAVTTTGERFDPLCPKTCGLC